MKTHVTSTGIRLDRWKLCAAVMIVTAGGFGAFAQTNGYAPPDFSSFRMISQRNIFNQNRSGPVRARTQAVRRRPTEAFTLVGTMIYEKGRFAFFDGTSSDYQKVVEPGAMIAGHKLIEVTANSVKLGTAGSPVTMRVGSQMRRDDQGAWYSAEGTELPSSRVETAESGAEADSSSVAAAPAASVPPAADAGTSDILKRLMQQREQELK